jgi:hypothetical protein
MMPPIVYEVSIPSAHSTKRITQMVQSIFFASFAKDSRLFVRE